MDDAENTEDNNDYFSRKRQKEQIVELMKSGDWRAVLSLYDAPRRYHEPLLVWVRPSSAMLHFIEDQLLSLGISNLLSIGCGCAFLEWLLNQATRIKATGLEVNSGWWESGYSTPHFVPLVYTEAGVVPELPPDSAIMFNYFNNGKYFEEYLSAYAGDCVILIGPVDGKRCCDPEPSYLAETAKHAAVWRLAASHDVRAAGEDEVAVYVRRGRSSAASIKT